MRQLHEVCWNKTNPEWSRKPKKTLIKLIMDQRKNASADLAKVLSIQEQVADSMWTAKRERRQEQEAFLEKKWREFEALAKQVGEGRVTELEKRCEEGRAQLETTQDAAEKSRLQKAINADRQEIRKLLQAHRMVEKRDAAQEPIQAKFDRETKRRQAKIVYFTRMKQTEELEKVQASPEPKMGRNEVYYALLPKFLKSKPAHFSVRNIRVEWADLLDAEYATGSWPESVTHEALQGGLGTKTVLTSDEFSDRCTETKAHIAAETERVLEEMKLEAENARRKEQGLPPLEPKAEVEEEVQPKTGLAKYTGWIRNPFRRASA